MRFFRADLKCPGAIGHPRVTSKMLITIGITITQQQPQQQDGQQQLRKEEVVLQ